MNLRQTYVSHLLGWCLLFSAPNSSVSVGLRAHELWCDKQHVAPIYSSQTCPHAPADPGDAETNKVYPKHIHSTGDTLPNTTWPHRTHSGPSRLHKLASVFFQFFCLLFESQLSCHISPVPVQLTWLQTQDSHCMGLSSSSRRSSLNAPMDYLQAHGPGHTYTAVPRHPAPPLHSSSWSCSTVFLKWAAFSSQVFFSAPMSLSVYDCLVSLVYK